ncbi:RNA polymerase II subunit A C-terminal domain phosphatase isoform X2 [Orussus abietinus]|uniref:RNA polymerase II subunit A C-terminal domain phosphatase isoform X2 n=1 Tax=Orussus abietinus TaxID=222816 RepID=UPI0006267A68|nr:RNA polymerase II subunit A C-terminal domain phosphatase isoform X2 [Orussus abietinus]
MATIEVTFPSEGQQARIIKWRVGKGTMVSAGRVLLLYDCIASENDDVRGPEKKLRATQFGRVTKLLAKEGDILQPGQVILTLEGCTHPTVMKDLCAECGIDLREDSGGKDGEKGMISQASVPMVHSIPELKVCPELAEKIGKQDEERLLQDRKLALLVDLDQTIVHTTNDNIPPNMKDVYHYQLYGPNSPWYHTRLRPNTHHFLSKMSHLYELHICTFGARNYAHMVASLLDRDGVLFSHRILSRDECFDPASKTANLKALFPCGDDMVCIIDDREDVWQGCGNLVQVKPYHFFRHTGDIHAPPGLGKYDPPTSPSLDSQYTEKDYESKNPENGVLEESNDETNKEDKGTNDGKKDLENKNEDGSGDKEMPKGNISEKESDKNVALKLEKDETLGTKNEETETEREKDETLETNKDSIPEVKKDVADTESSKENETEIGEKKEDDTKPKFIEHEDQDDYLLYLEDILRRIHNEFYHCLDAGSRKPLRDIIPRVRGQVLKGLHLTFSGLIPTHQKLEQNRAYKVARALGAEVNDDLVEGTTHLVAIRPGTAKVNSAKRNGKIKIVNPDWLWTCAERWERVDERLFPLNTKAPGSRIPPPHCSNPKRADEESKKRCDSFADSINPLMSFTQEEIANMDKEVEEDMSDQEMMDPDLETEDTEIEDSQGEISPTKKRRTGDDSSIDDSSSSQGHIRDVDDLDDDDDDPATRFRRGEDLPDDLDLGDNSQDSVDVDVLDNDDNEDDREWNAMGAALEREFLSD